VSAITAVQALTGFRLDFQQIDNAASTDNTHGLTAAQADGSRLLTFSQITNLLISTNACTMDL
jgi:hypothetical protein